MEKILHRLLMAALGTAAIFTINALNTLTEASPAAEFDGAEILLNRPESRVPSQEIRVLQNSVI
ncbi:MAG: hypothetical protein HC849_08895 [Oscillatoriales cyanobacterium RU_3_3]|nr:hypothetical protein [Microcoleus sp. SU_5_6]NJM60265.1 hypothetical protein [Oscillatoriales cyanobacterium RU_3_3]NJR25176.1 hypothetical protein [Richelia sp. CSU_2_1]